MKAIYDHVSQQCAKVTTRKYSTSFSLGIRLLKPSIRGPIYSIYGMVRFADEIVDTFHDYPKAQLLEDFKKDCYKAIDQKISLNPILNAFQEVVNTYNIPLNLVESFFRSMEMDLDQNAHDIGSLEEYIVGSAEVVGLMCLCVFVDGDQKRYEELKYSAERLGAAFQKVNFLRDLKFDAEELGRSYFPQLSNGWDIQTKAEIEADIQQDFDDALVGIKQLPKSSQLGVFLAYEYYLCLFMKIKRNTPESVMKSRIRISNGKKLGIMLRSYTAYNLQLV